MAKDGLYIDTNIFIYLLESHPELSEKAAEAFEHHAGKGGHFLTSTITITEFCSSKGNPPVAALHRVLGLSFTPVTETIAEQAAYVRQESGLKLGDAIHVATAMSLESRLLTHDKELAKKALPFIEVLTLDT